MFQFSKQLSDSIIQPLDGKEKNYWVVIVSLCYFCVYEQLVYVLLNILMLYMVDKPLKS